MALGGAVVVRPHRARTDVRSCNGSGGSASAAAWGWHGSTAWVVWLCKRQSEVIYSRSMDSAAPKEMWGVVALCWVKT
jgi:hypothetical protein